MVAYFEDEPKLSWENVKLFLNEPLYEICRSAPAHPHGDPDTISPLTPAQKRYNIKHNICNTWR